MSQALVDALLDREGLGLLLEVRNWDSSRFDVLLVHNSKSGASLAILYVGLTKVVDLEERGGLFKLRCRKTEVAERHFKDSWKVWQGTSGLIGDRRAIREYLDEASRAVPERSLRREGAVQGTICSGHVGGIAVITREAIPRFTNTAVRQRWSSEIEVALIAALDRVDHPEPWWPTRRKIPLGLEADVLAVDDMEDLLVIAR